MHLTNCAPRPEIAGDSDLMHAAGDIGTTIFHPVGTCRMGQNSMAVVDSRLRLRGLAGLRIADASIVLFFTSGNNILPTIMTTEKVASMIFEDAS
jgi:choline dehydrogenase